MAIRIPYGIDVDEVWELDFCAESARAFIRLHQVTAESLRATAAVEKDEARKEAFNNAATEAEGKAQAAEADLKGYLPGSGPVFRVGSILARRRAELVGRKVEVDSMPEGSARAVAQVEWARDVVLAAVKGHRNLVRPAGGEVPFDLVDGKPSERTLEAYGSILSELAWVIFAQQRLGPDAKNA